MRLRMIGNWEGPHWGGWYFKAPEREPRRPRYVALPYSIIADDLLAPIRRGEVVDLDVAPYQLCYTLDECL